MAILTFISPCMCAAKRGHTLSPQGVDKTNNPIMYSPQDFHDYYQHVHSNENHGPSPRKIKPFSSPLTKKIRIATTPTEWGAAQGEEPCTTLSPPKQMPSLAPSSRHNIRLPSPTTIEQITNKPVKSANVLAPCHICHRKPTKKTELDSYADCEGCGERTCYVCIRACSGAWRSPTTKQHQHLHRKGEYIMRDGEADESGQDQQEERLDQSFTMMEDAPTTPTTNDDERTSSATTTNNTKMAMKREETWGKGGGTGTGHRGRICSQCCVEEGPEGEVICLGCLGT